MSFLIWHSLYSGLNVSILQNLKTRLQEQNLKNILIFFHYHLNLFICYKTKSKIKVIFYWMSLFKQNNFFTEWNSFNTVEFFERGYKYLFWINNFFWKIKIFTEKKKKNPENHTHIFLKNIIIFRIVFLHLNNHTCLLKVLSDWYHWIVPIKVFFFFAWFWFLGPGKGLKFDLIREWRPN